MAAPGFAVAIDDPALADDSLVEWILLDADGQVVIAGPVEGGA